MVWLTSDELRTIHEYAIRISGGSEGIRDFKALESALGQPFQSFGGQDLYPHLLDKAAALGYFLIRNHPFVDGNKRVGHAAIEIVLKLNGYELNAEIDEQESIILQVASNQTSLSDFSSWIRSRVAPF